MLSPVMPIRRCDRRVAASASAMKARIMHVKSRWQNKAIILTLGIIAAFRVMKCHWRYFASRLIKLWVIYTIIIVSVRLTSSKRQCRHSHLHANNVASNVHYLSILRLVTFLAVTRAHEKWHSMPISNKPRPHYVIYFPVETMSYVCNAWCCCH